MPETRLLRRRPNGALADTLHTLLIAVLILSLLSTARAVLETKFRNIWIDLQSVTVPDHEAGQDPMITAWRAIHRDFPGTWMVSIREAGTHRLIYAVDGGARITYKKAASVNNPLVMPLSKWMRDGEALRAAEGNGFGEGQFYIRTCHFAYFAGFIPFSRCVDSAPFHRWGRAQ